MAYSYRIYSMRMLFFTLALTLSFSSEAQVIDNTPTYLNIKGDSYIRINYDNDFFSAKDEYYSQGVNIELALPSLKKFPLTKTLVRPSSWQNKYSIAIEHDAWTPTDIAAPFILYGDRPFAATLQLK